RGRPRVAVPDHARRTRPTRATAKDRSRSRSAGLSFRLLARLLPCGLSRAPRPLSGLLRCPRARLLARLLLAARPLRGLLLRGLLLPGYLLSGLLLSGFLLCGFLAGLLRGFLARLPGRLPSGRLLRAARFRGRLLRALLARLLGRLLRSLLPACFCCFLAGL